MKIGSRFIWGLVFFYLFAVQLWAVWPFTVDDMYIPLRYARHWAAGEGLFWNVGQEVVEGYSNFSFLVFGHLAFSVGLDPVLVLKSLGVFSLLLTVVAIYAIGRMWMAARYALIPCVWLLCYQGQIEWAASGLETTLYEALCCFSVVFLFRGLGYSYSPSPRCDVRLSSFAVAGMFLAWAGMTRPEAPLLVMLFAGLLGVSGVFTRRVWVGLLVFCGVWFIWYAPYFAWRWHYYGRLFPNPVYCKGGAYGDFFSLDAWYLRLIWPFFLLALPVFLNQKKSDCRGYFLGLPSGLYLLLLVSAAPVVAFDNRLFLTAFALSLPLAAYGLWQILFAFFSKDQPVVFDAWWYLSVFLVIFFFIPMLTPSGYRYFVLPALAGERLRYQVIDWLAEHVRPGGWVVLGDSGLIPYQSKLNFIDSYCLNNAKMTQGPVIEMYQDFCHQVLQTKPDAIILTARITATKTQYEPSDACLVRQLAHHPEYVLQRVFVTGMDGISYRYEGYLLVKNR